MKSVTAAEAAALAAWRVLAQKDRVGALVFNDTEVAEICPQRSRATVMRILNEVLLSESRPVARGRYPVEPCDAQRCAASLRASRGSTMRSCA
jgi:uncharacterized protein (DUF58 family)